jgi:hypothetical protein
MTPPSVDLRRGDRSVPPCFGHHCFYPVERFPDGRVLHCCDNCPTEEYDDPAGTAVLSERAVQSSGGGS